MSVSIRGWALPCVLLPGPHGVSVFVEVGGGAIAVLSNTIEMSHNASGTCEKAIANLALPSAPLCVVSVEPSQEVQVACSGPTSKVVEAFGRLTKSVLALP